MEKWVSSALDYIPGWIEFQLRVKRQPGAAIAVVHQGELIFEAAFGHADLGAGEKLTPRHRFRVASHSKSVLSAGIFKLREQGRIGLEHRVGDYLKDLHPDVAAVTIGQLLSHTAGLIRDGHDSGQWMDRRPFLNEAEIRADVANGTVIPPNTRLKYSNHGFGLLSLVIKAITGEPYGQWIAREIIAPSGLTETLPDAPLAQGTPFAKGHSLELPLGRRLAIGGQNVTHDLAGATGLISTAADLARFFYSLSPDAKKSVLSVASRREMARPQWREELATDPRWYGLGIISGKSGGWDWFGHTGGFQGYVTRTSMVPAADLAISVLTNAADGISHGLADGALNILSAFKRSGPAGRETAPWSGRWWDFWGTCDLLPMGDKVLVADPALDNPLEDATEFSVKPAGADGIRHGTITLANSFGEFGETVRLVPGTNGGPGEFWLAGKKLLSERQVADELTERYGID